MTAIELYKFIHSNTIGWHWQDNDDTPDVLIFLTHYQLEMFRKLLSPSQLSDGGINIRMLDSYYAVWMNDVCEYYGIDIEEIFKKGQTK